MSGYHLNRGMVGGLRFVRHRIDGLEKWRNSTQMIVNVRHRIDGLEKQARAVFAKYLVRHRIDGLET